jgi:hypothetical protein
MRHNNFDYQKAVTTEADLTVVIDGGEKAIGGPPFTNEQGNRF